ncbi:MAG: hypothetical protein D6772_09960 [Bacteroidetes bacterium]|nr:MAG: hypothetical protein D6772_09960 [Bacteroidota bacterium]
MPDFLQAVLDQLQELLNVLPNVITAVAIFILGLVIAKMLRRLTGRTLALTGIDRLAERFNTIDLVAQSNVTIKPSTFLAATLYYLVLFVFSMAAVEALGMRAISQLMTDFINYLPKAFSALLLLVLGIVVCDLIKKAVLTTCESVGIPAARLIANVVFYFLFLNVILVTMKQAELQTTFMEHNISIVLAGVVFAFSIGYGLASRSMMSNMLSAFYNREKFQPGDEITIEGQRGTVITADNTSLSLRVQEGELVVPLHKLSADSYTIHRRARNLALEQEDEAND